jgi:hypothetical protein
MLQSFFKIKPNGSLSKNYFDLLKFELNIAVLSLQVETFSWFWAGKY